jgi:hypothetical protein
MRAAARPSIDADTSMPVARQDGGYSAAVSPVPIPISRISEPGRIGSRRIASRRPACSAGPKIQSYIGPSRAYAGSMRGSAMSDPGCKNVARGAPAKAT